MVIVIYVFFWICLIINSVMTVRIIKFLRSEIDNQIETSNIAIIKNVIEKLYLLPIITLFLWFFATLNRFYELYYFYYGSTHQHIPNEFIYSRLILYTIQTTLMSCRGWIYALVYCRYNTIKREINKFFNFLCCRSDRKISSLEGLISI